MFYCAHHIPYPYRDSERTFDNNKSNLGHPPISWIEYRAMYISEYFKRCYRLKKALLYEVTNRKQTKIIFNEEP